MLPHAVQAGDIAEAEGASGVILHARTADRPYTPEADWEAISQLVTRLHIPVVGNGGCWEAAEALLMMRHCPGLAGVMIGRAALGRPWVFGEVAALMRGQAPPPPPPLGEVLSIARRHLHLWAEWDSRGAPCGSDGAEAAARQAVLKMRKMWPLYLHGFTTAQQLQAALLQARTLAEVDTAIGGGGGRSSSSSNRSGGGGGSRLSYEPHEPYPWSGLRHVRLKGGGRGAQRQRVSLPHGWLEGRMEEVAPAYVSDAACEG